MRKTISIIGTILLMITLLPACSPETPVSEGTAQPTLPAETTATEQQTAQPTEEPQTEPTAADISYNEPIDLFDGELNPFSVIGFPESYMPYKVSVKMSTDFGQYMFSLLAEDTEIVSFIAPLLNVTDENEIAALTQELQEGSIEKTGTYNDIFDFDVEIKPVEADEHDYVDASGYTVTLTTQLSEDMLAPYRQILMQNISRSAFQSVGAEDIIDQYDLDGNGSITVVTGSVNYIFAGFSFKLGEDYGKWSDYFSSDTYFGYDNVAYWGEENVSMFSYGELETRVELLPENNVIMFYQNIGNTEVNVQDYVPPLSLIIVGFDKMRNFTSEDGNIYIGVRKELFGDETDEFEGNNYIKYIDNSGNYDCFLIIYYKPDAKYYVRLDKDGNRAEYYYYAFEDKFTDMNGGEDIGELKKTMQTIMNTDADMIMGEPVVIFEQYIKNTFGVNSDALYDMPLE